MIDPEMAWYDVGVAALALLAHALIPRFRVACLLTATLATLVGCGLLIAADPGLKPGWAVPVAGVAFAAALPISFAVGMAVQALRWFWRLGRVERLAGESPSVPPDILPEQEPRP